VISRSFYQFLTFSNDFYRLPINLKELISTTRNHQKSKKSMEITEIKKSVCSPLDLSDHQVLIRAAEQIGFNGNQIKEFLQSNQHVKEVQQEINQSQREGISGVPHFRINDRIELSGAQDSQQFLQAFRKVGVQI
jgi:predicted DsbA family dithiol-disulfide isomerase